MARSIMIRDVPDDVYDELSVRAAATGRSLEAYLRLQLIQLAQRPDPEVVLRRIADRVERTGSKLSAASILRHRDAGRRYP